ncbi:pentatricopeptide repeat-containing protein At4g21065 [Selaginella moellendorffii]|uniref:pentatricopeptide repeat-containing protein At4g21065 n=1 Tax=Selaginella moellendorffii TaxID=88036 RepID=UPI000D1CF442|nr:pentatricopeptide repeat-containing protein At4g21065 [Selaginella moellendorffii]|eukprot:XP_024529292.1 pentatricopeptide repeat-containing protein At4g21065 [Selaginella moellendorffii]
MIFNARRQRRFGSSPLCDGQCRNLVLLPPPEAVSSDSGAPAARNSSTFPPSRVAAFASLLQQCGRSRSLPDGRRIHAEIVDTGLGKDLFLGNHLIQMYGKCGAMEDARAVFEKIESPNVFSWSIIIGACVDNGLARRALELYHWMDHQGVRLDMVVLINLVSACSSLGSLDHGRALEARITSMGFHLHPVVRNSLLNMYCKAGSLDDARKFFQDMAGDQSVVSWTAMISGFALHGREDLALDFFRKMVAEGVRPNEVTFVSILGACAAARDVKHGTAIHELVESSEFGRSYLSVGTALIDMYGKCGRPELASRVFEKMERRDLVVWNAMITVCSQQGLDEQALRLFRVMDLEGHTPDEVTLVAALEACSNLNSLAAGKKLHELILDAGLDSSIVRNSLLHMYGKCGGLDEARRVFEHCGDCRNLITWSTMIAAYSLNGDGRQALSLYKKMDLEGLKPDEYTFTSLLDACSIAGDALAEGRALHRRLEAKGLEKKMVLATALVNMYGRYGQLEDALRVFEKMNHWNLVAWTALIAAFAQHGDVHAIDLSWRMHLEGVQADDIVFLSVLHACSHAGVLEAGLSCFQGMVADFGVRGGAAHYSCMVDLLARCGRVAEAEELLHSMPFEPAHMEMKTLLAACRVSGDTPRGARVARLASGLIPLDAAPYVLMSHAYAAAEKWDEVAEVRERMAKLGVKKPRGWSCVEVKNRVHQFFAGNFSWHSEAAEIEVELRRLQAVVKEAGYVPDTGQIGHCVQEDDKEDLLALHSERVAIAFGLLRVPAGLPIHVVKNLRVCSDCHAVAKIISRSVGRRIVVRDAYRFHRFENGTCSCGDYW